jgi:2-dehydropantoate 2-reductase
MNMTKVCVFGAGAVGSHVAAWLARGGLQVSMLARGAALEAINADGLRFESAHASFTVNPRASDDARALGEQDLVIVALKANALPDAAEAMLPLLGPRTPVVFAVNGIPWWYAPGDLPLLDPQRKLEQAIGVRRAIGCVVSSPNTLRTPGVVHNSASVNRFVFGEPGGGTSDRL